MKTNYLIPAVLLFIIYLCGCTPTPEEILKKYETYPEVNHPAVNQAGLHWGSMMHMSNSTNIGLVFSNPLINKSPEIIDILAKRIIVLNAEKPSEVLPIQAGTMKNTIRTNNGPAVVEYSLILGAGKGLKAKYLLIGFKGIDEKESEVLATPPMFFLYSLTGKGESKLTQYPLLATDLISTDFPVADFVYHAAALKDKDKTYIVSIGEIAEDENGNRTVEFISNEIEIKKDYLNRPIIPLTGEITVGGEVMSPIRYSISPKYLMFTYETKEMPEDIIVRLNNGDTNRPAIIFDGETKKVTN